MIARYKSIIMVLLISLLVINEANAASPECISDVAINGKLTLAPPLNNQMPDFTDQAKNSYKLADIYSPTDLPQNLIEQRNALIKSFLDGQQKFYHNEAGFTDRYKRDNHHIFGENSQNWLQGKLISAGLAYVAPNSKALSCIDDLLALEKSAQTVKTGLWASKKFSIKNPNDTKLLQQKSKFQVIQGKIFGTGQTKTTIYLNFGALWKEDFTVKIPRQIFKSFDFGEISIDQLKDKTVIIRGWLLENDGPLIELTHPKQMQIEY